MPLILNIDTAVQSASVCLANGANVLSLSVNPSERESAAWLHSALQSLLQEQNVHVRDLNAVAVSAGPGSYTGLRVGMAAAKGLCYALSVPLISVPTLQMMAGSVQHTSAQLLCPMIDARRTEVFTALYDRELNELMPAGNLILHEDSFNQWLDDHSVLFFGNGSEKAISLIQHPRAAFATIETNATHMAALSAIKFECRQFSELAYTEPKYGKAFYSPALKGKQ